MGKKKYKSSGQGSGQGTGAGWALLLLVYLVIKLFWWIVAAGVAVGLFYLVRAIVRENRRRRELSARRCAEIAARAEQQHNWVMQGDDRGTYGPDGAELMREIRSWPPGFMT